MTFLTTKTARCCYGTGSQRSHRCCRVFFRVRYRPSYGNGLTAADSHGAPCCPASRDADKFHHHRPPPDLACEYTVLPQEMSSSSYGRCAALGRRVGEDDDDHGAGGWHGCSCRRLGTAPRPSDPIAYLSGTVDRQPGSWTDDEVDDEAHRHCTCTSGRSWTAPRDRPGKTSPK